MTDLRHGPSAAIITLAVQIADVVESTTMGKGFMSWQSDPSKPIREVDLGQAFSPEALDSHLATITALLRNLGGILADDDPRNALAEAGWDNDTSRFLAGRGLAADGWQHQIKPGTVENRRGAEQLADAIDFYAQGRYSEALATAARGLAMRAPE